MVTTNLVTNMKHGFDGIIMLFVGITIAVVMVANVVLPQIFNANNSTWDAGTRALWTILGLVVVAVLILMIFGGRR